MMIDLAITTWKGDWHQTVLWVPESEGRKEEEERRRFWQPPLHSHHRQVVVLLQVQRKGEDIAGT